MILHPEHWTIGRQGDTVTRRQGDFSLSPSLPLSLSQSGGMGFISVAECEVLHNNALINIHMAHTAAEMGVARYGAEEQRS